MAKGPHISPFLSCISAISLFLSVLNTTALDITGRKRSLSSNQNSKRDASGTFGNGSLALANIADVQYLGNVTLGGKNFEVLIDTDSVDLYVVGDVPGTKDLGIPLNLSYADRADIAGNISTAQLQFDGYSIQDQAYLRVNHTDDSLSGVLGLGPTKLSDIRNLVNSSAGDPMINRIFQQNSSTPNYITFLLSRNASIEGNNLLSSDGYYPAQLTIGDIIPGLEGINNAPKLQALEDQKTFGGTWVTLLDADGIIGLDGKRINTTTMVQNVTAGTEEQLRVLLDTGTSLPQLPAHIVDAIYGKIPGAKFIQNGGDIRPDLDVYTNFWRIPCNQEVNVSFIFSSQEFPVAPLDLSSEVGMDKDSVDICIATFQQVDPSVAEDPGSGAHDMVLGMAFLRNVYALFNYGDFVDNSTSRTSAPYIQFLTISDKAKIHQDFVNARLSGGNSTSSGSNSGHGSSVTAISEILALGLSALMMVFGAAGAAL
ncbi:hypothetical protein D9758_002638 [Tetrapyrgos nigripes]|uniref:Peptidase A1 domain-containing protein n=1 Tax=Tetrapyrgos nigripes TaxID=182062 RepID=A0A8H5GQN4_9AGAR|nr:hypothetical protein D9758_002638 [Tetrapyrgos nigripes]